MTYAYIAADITSGRAISSTLAEAIEEAFQWPGIYQVIRPSVSEDGSNSR